jgi:hypothetical protein
MPNYCLMGAVGQRQIIPQLLILGDTKCAQPVGQCRQMRFLRIEENIVAVPMLSLDICDDFRANAVNRNIPAGLELFPSILEGLLVDVVFAALAWDWGREHHKRAVRRQCIDKFGGAGTRQMLDDLEACTTSKRRPRLIGRLRSAARNSFASIIKYFCSM